MNIDWVVAFGIFIIFAMWSFGYFAGIYRIMSDPLRSIAEDVNAGVVDFLSMDVVTVPIRHEAKISSIQSVLYLEYNWSFGRNTSRVFSPESGELPCSLMNNTVFFLTSLESGINFFEMIYTNETGQQPNCNSTFLVENETRANPLAETLESVISQDRIDSMLSMDYDAFRRGIKTNRNVRVEIEKSSGGLEFGPSSPPASSVVVRETLTRIQDTGEDVRIRVLVW